MFILFINRNEQPYCDIAILRYCDDINQLIVTQYFNYVYNYVCHIFSIQHTYIVLYCIAIFCFYIDIQYIGYRGAL